jgi:tetratricopeptide (TPR) repeat protein
MEVGDFKEKNYRGAELRFRDALNYKPDQPDATFKLAEALDKLGKEEEAKQNYQTYLNVQQMGLTPSVPESPLNDWQRSLLARTDIVGSNPRLANLATQPWFTLRSLTRFRANKQRKLVLTPAEDLQQVGIVGTFNRVVR